MKTVSQAKKTCSMSVPLSAFQRRREKGNPGRRHTPRFFWAAGLLVAAVASVGIAQTGLPPAQNAGGVEYVTGGFGDDMAEAFKQAEASYPLALTFAEDAGGGSRPYIAEVRVVIKDEAGNVVMDVPSAGPYFLARLAPGKYVVEATYMGDTQTHDVTVAQGDSLRQVLTWKTS